MTEQSGQTPCHDEADTLWFSTLDNFWGNYLWGDTSRLRDFARRLGLAVVPISIMPFREDHVLAQYISGEHGVKAEQSCETCTNLDLSNDIGKYLLLLQDAHSKKCQRLIPAPGLHRALLSPNPAVWFSYTDKKAGVDIDFANHIEKPFFEQQLSAQLGSSYSDRKGATITSLSGQFMIPLFFGTIPVYVLVVLSQSLEPRYFTRRLLDAVFDAMTEIGESILNDIFHALWREYATALADKGLVSTEKGFSVYLKWLSGNGNPYFSWVHNLPGHRLAECSGRVRQIEELLRYCDNNAKCWLRSHDDMLAFFQRVSGDNFFSGSYHECSADALDHLPERIKHSDWWSIDYVRQKIATFSRPVTKDECNELKAVLHPINSVDKKGRLSLALLADWGQICREYKLISVKCTGRRHSRVTVSKDPYLLVDSLYWLIYKINAESDLGCSATMEVTSDSTGGSNSITIMVTGVPNALTSSSSDHGETSQAYMQVVNYFAGDLHVNDDGANSKRLTITC